MMKWWGWGDPNKTFPIHEKPGLVDFLKHRLAISLETKKVPITRAEIKLTPPIYHHEFVTALEQHLQTNQIMRDDDSRINHAYGKSYRDLLRARNGIFHRVPDLIVYPQTSQDIETILQLASQHGVVIIPFGGGSNIVGATEVLPECKRMAVILNMQRMNKVLSIDKNSMLATIQAGILGPDLEKQLNQHGVSIGHFPDSFEFSTFGGWLATRSAGMQSDCYGKIEDMVHSQTMVTPIGVITTPCVPRAATGPDLNQIICGSEGTLGVITEATVRIHPLQQKHFRGYLFPDFRSGAAAIQDCVQQQCVPLLARLSNADETALGFSMRGHAEGLQKKIAELFKVYLRKFKKFDFSQVCLLIVGFEGDSKSIKAQHRKVNAIYAKHRGVDLGQNPGDKWYHGKYDYPYLRDFIMDFGVIVDVTETSASWSKILDLYFNVEKNLKPLLACTNAPGYLGCHLSHSYFTGACLYFTFSTVAKSKQELEEYLVLKYKIVDTILASGGSLSHHHAIGYEHAPWLANYLGDIGLNTLRAIKKKLDPHNVCNPEKLL